MDKNELIKTLKENRLWAKKRLGQNFLVSQKTLNKIIETAGIKPNDTIVEIGSGLGVLTEELGKRAKLVLAIEKDYHFVEYLRKRFKNSKNIKIIHADILTYDLGLIRLGSPEARRVTYNYKVVANLPYNITSPVIRKFLETNPQPYALSPTLSMMILMVQKEVAERICAKPGSSDRGILTVMVEFYVYPEHSRGAEIIEIVDRSCFWPSPNVDSAIIKLTTYNLQLTTRKNIDDKIFFRIVKAGFSQKRRQIHNPLSAVFHLPNNRIKDILKSAKINPTLRAEDLSLEDWIKLYHQLKVES